MTQGDQSSIDLGTDDHGVRFTWTPDKDVHVDAHGTLELNVWCAEWDEAAGVMLGSDDALDLAQWINARLGRD